jgi:hypothetical protein
MKAISALLLVLLMIAGTAFAQEDPEAQPPADPPPTAEAVPPPAAPVAAPPDIKVHELESLTIAALRKEFPRLAGIFASAHSCRLPEYGPMVSVTIQIPAYYFTRPVLQELDRRQRAAEEQARKVRSQLERASQVISLRAKEASLMERIEFQASTKKKSKDMMEELQTELSTVRKSLEDLESGQPSLLLVQETHPSFSEVDLNNMLTSNYQQLIQRVSKAMKNSLAENGPRVSGLNEYERVTLNTYIRDSMLGSSGKSMLFILHKKDIQEFKEGGINLDELRERVLVHDTPRD